MQERRAEIRISHHSRVLYAPCSDGSPETGFQPKDGRLTSVSERGAGLLTREPHACGERVAVSFTLPRFGDRVTSTGVVRWSRANPGKRRWYPLGVEWVATEHGDPNRLGQWLEPSAVAPRAASSAVRTRLASLGAVLFLAAALAGARIAWSFHRQREAFALLLQEREAALSASQRRERSLIGTLAEMADRLNDTSQDLARLGRLAQVLEGQAQQFQGALRQVQDSSATLRRQRDGMMDQVMALEQQRLGLEQRYGERLVASIPVMELQTAIREALALRRKPSLSTPPPPAAVTIRVHDPQLQ